MQEGSGKAETGFPNSLLQTRAAISITFETGTLIVLSASITGVPGKAHP
jgi:hypothetical protein